MNHLIPSETYDNVIQYIPCTRTDQEWLSVVVVTLSHLPKLFHVSVWCLSKLLCEYEYASGAVITFAFRCLTTGMRNLASMWRRWVCGWPMVFCTFWPLVGVCGWPMVFCTFWPLVVLYWMLAILLSIELIYGFFVCISVPPPPPPPPQGCYSLRTFYRKKA